MNETVSAVCDDIKREYGEETQEVGAAQAIALRLAEARKSETSVKGVTSATKDGAKIAIESVEAGDWGPMLQFLSHEKIGSELFAGVGGVPWLENLIASLEE